MSITSSLDISWITSIVTMPLGWQKVRLIICPKSVNCDQNILTGPFDLHVWLQLKIKNQFENWKLIYFSILGHQTSLTVRCLKVFQWRTLTPTNKKGCKSGSWKVNWGRSSWKVNWGRSFGRIYVCDSHFGGLSCQFTTSFSNIHNFISFWQFLLSLKRTHV